MLLPEVKEKDPPTFVVLSSLHAYHSLPPAERSTAVAFAILTTSNDSEAVRTPPPPPPPRPWFLEACIYMYAFGLF